MLSAWRLRAEWEEGLAGHLSASAQRAAALCGAGAAMALHPFKLWGKDTVEGCVGPVVFFFFCCCSHNCWSWTAFKNLHCQVGSFSRWTTALLSLSLVLRYADISRKHTHRISYKCMPPTHSLPIFPVAFNNLVCLTLGFLCTLLVKESSTTVCKCFNHWFLD